ncbi:PAS domain S-box protein [Lysobacter sp. GX 14042]|uniref:sensor domain-containing diguanylate cyclase n=1 Tax=Lysobacter sp. GX 14042 TaxID=2907155 RepID=UPI001F1D4E28|nr:PAS domain S-box protein [Lysobacter sp. GX 14042]
MPHPPAVANDAPGADHLRTIYDGVAVFLGLLTPEGVLVDVNRAALELIGARREDVTGRHFDQTPWFADQDQAERLREALRQAAAGQTAVIRTAHPTRDGGRVEVELRLSPVFEDGTLAWIIPEGRDISARRRAERAREASEQRLAGILDVAADAIVSIDEDQRIVLFNQGAEAVFGYAAGDVLGQPLEVLLPEAARDGHGHHVQGFGSRGPQSRFMNQRGTITGRRRSGELFPAEATISRLEVDGERLFTAVLRDIGERLRQETELARARRYTEALLTSVPDGIFGLDRNGRIVFANPAATELLGYEAHELIGREAHALVHHSRADGSPYPFGECPAWHAINEGVVSRSADDVYWRADGSSMPVEYTMTPFGIDGEVAGAVIVFRDIAERKQAEAALRSLSWIDELTGLCNRRGFHAHAGRALQQAQRAGTGCLLLFIDLDFLKPINDRHGHLAGDQALREVGGLLRTVFRDSDVLARVGGDEFVVLAVGCGDPRDEAAARDRLHSALETRNARTGVTFPLSVSVGAARFDPSRPKSLEELIGEADAALYAEKHRRFTAR